LAADGAPLPPQAVATQGDLRDVSSGFLTCALDVAGQMQCWGGQRADWSGNADGGNGPWAVKPDANWRQLSARDTQVCAITRADKLYCWGKNDHGQLGDATTDDSASPVPVEHAGGWQQVSTGSASGFTCAIDHDQALYCWGDNHFGQLGNGESGGEQPS